MSDSEDDYMSDKFLASLTAVKEEDVRPGLLFNRTAKRQHELYKQKQERIAKKPKTAREVEEELREKGLNTAITSDNKGFQLLEKMGFKPGEGLGKTKSGLKEPIKIEMKQGTSGVGREKHIKEKVTLKRERKDNNLAAAMQEFKTVTKERTLRKFLQADFRKAQRVCEELDLRNGVEDPIEDFFWTRATIKKRSKIDDEDEDEVEEFNEFFEMYTNDENLVTVIDYLRNRHLYCMYCAFVASDDADLNNSCPGPYRNDHDDS